jgi:aryl-alcohol dehydrogenase-like predicted oxidoreductase
VVFTCRGILFVANVGMRKPEHVRQNLRLSEAGPLPSELLAELKKHRWERKPKAWSA